MPRFVILYHDCPQGSHYDLMLEIGDVLKTWSLAQPPEAHREAVCKALPDHRRDYLDYEGPVSGGRGSVTCWDRGACEIDKSSPARWLVTLRGEKLMGLVTLTPPHTDVAAASWTLLYAPQSEA